MCLHVGVFAYGDEKESWLVIWCNMFWFLAQCAYMHVKYYLSVLFLSPCFCARSFITVGDKVFINEGTSVLWKQKDASEREGWEVVEMLTHAESKSEGGSDTDRERWCVVAGGLRQSKRN